MDYIIRNIERLDNSLANQDVYNLREMLYQYYKEGEDKNTPDIEIYQFINYLVEMIKDKKLRAAILSDKENKKSIGFVLWFSDEKEHDFSNLENHFSIAEIFIRESYRKQGYGKALVDFAEKDSINNQILSSYVCVFNGVESFWRKMGYFPSHRTAKNGLPIFIKALSEP